MGGQGLFFQPADRQDPPSKGNLSGHRDITVDRDVSQSGDYSRCHGNPSRRTVFGNGALRYMDMQICFFVEVLSNPEFFGARTDVANCGLCGFTHYFTEFTCEEELSLAFNR